MRKIKPKTEEYMTESPAGLKKGKDAKKVYPRLRLEHEFFPEAKKWDVGKEYEVTLKLKMTGLSISKYQNDSEFDIIGFGVKNSKNSDDYKE